MLIIGVQDHNRRFKLIFEFGLGKGFAPTRLIISIFHRLIGQYFESGILFISLANLHGGKRWLDVWERRRQAPLYSTRSPRWVYSAYLACAYLYFKIYKIESWGKPGEVRFFSVSLVSKLSIDQSAFRNPIRNPIRNPLFNNPSFAIFRFWDEETVILYY